MLLDQPVRSEERRVAVAVGETAFAAVLGELLREWGYALRPQEADLLLAEEGRHSGGSRCLALLRGDGGGDRLHLPVAPEELWVAVGRCFHLSLRQYIRLPLRYPVKVHARGRSCASHLTSLSEMGGRFDHDRELAIGEEVAIHLEAGAESFSLDGKVIYAIDRQELGGAEPLEVGMVFDRTEPKWRRRLRHLIVAAYLERIRRRLDPETFRAGLAGFHLPPGVLEDTFFA